MKHIEWHKETPVWVDAMTANAYVLFDESEAKYIAQQHNLKFLYIIFRELLEAGVIKKYKGRYAFNMELLNLYFGETQKWN